MAIGGVGASLRYFEPMQEGSSGPLQAWGREIAKRFKAFVLVQLRSRFSMQTAPLRRPRQRRCGCFPAITRTVILTGLVLSHGWSYIKLFGKYIAMSGKAIISPSTTKIAKINALM